MKLEVIATSVRDVEAIAKSKADRIEYCIKMEEGGLTPKIKDVKEALLVNKAPRINVMIRPTSKDFYYKNFFSFWHLKCQVHRFSRTKVNGLVFGVLDPETNKVDEKRMTKLMKIASRHGKDVTFHRAIDLVPNYEEAINFLAKIGVRTILTTGGSDVITNNFATLDELMGLKKIRVLGGSGINAKNASEVAKHVKEIHVGSAIRKSGWDSPIEIYKINEIKELITQKEKKE